MPYVNGKTRVIEVLIMVLMLILGAFIGRQTLVPRVDANTMNIQGNTKSIAVLQAEMTTEIRAINSNIADIKLILKENRR